MRILIVLLLLVGAAAAVFYETSVDLPSQRGIKPRLAASREPAAGEKDEDARLESEAAAGDRNKVDPITGDNPFSVPPVPPDAEAPSPVANPVLDGSKDAIRSERTQRDAQEASQQLAALRRTLAASQQREQAEARQAAGDLAAARKDIEAASKERAALSARVAALGDDNAKLRSSVQKAEDAVADQRRSADQAKRDAAGAGSDFTKLRSQVIASTGQAEEASAEAREADQRFRQADTLAKQLQSQLTELQGTAQRTITQMKAELATKASAADRQGASAADLSERLRGAEAEVRTLANERATAHGQMAFLTGRQGLAVAALQAARIALARADGRATSAQQAVDLAAARGRDLSSRADSLQAQNARARAEVDEMKAVLARAAANAAALQARLQAAESGQRIAAADLSRTQADRAALATQIELASSEAKKKLDSVTQRNAALTEDTARLPKLAQKVKDLETTIEADRKRQTDAAKLVAGLNLKSAGQLARIDTLIKKQAKEAQQQLAQARADPAKKLVDGVQNEKLQAALALAQAELAQAGRDAASAEHARQLAAKTVADDEAALAAERRQAALHVAEATKQLERERDRSGKLETDLQSAQSKLAQAAHDKLAADTARQSSEDAAREAKLRDERSQTARLTAEATKAAGDAAQLAAMTKRLAAERETTRRLETALASAKSQPARTTRSPATASDAVRLSEPAPVDARTRHHSEHAQREASPLGLSLPDPVAERRLQRPPAPTTIRAASLDDAKDATGKSPTQAQSVRSPLASSLGDGVGSGLPDALSAHVLLRYAHGKSNAQMRALAVGAKLKSWGVEVKEAALTNTDKPGDSVGYYYQQDRHIADRVAKQLDVPARLQTRARSAGAPRPGTIEVTVGG